MNLDTPALILDIGADERNIRKMADLFAGRPVRLRPHAKTHKTPMVAHKQLAAGAIGITCAKPGEAEVMAAGRRARDPRLDRDRRRGEGCALDRAEPARPHPHRGRRRGRPRRLGRRRKGGPAHPGVDRSRRRPGPHRRPAGALVRPGVRGRALPPWPGAFAAS
jgi:hypothetical protein